MNGSDHLIYPNQSVFVPGHLISNNIIIAYEDLQSMSTRMRGKEKYMVIKLDMSKAYDRIEWEFLQAVLLKLDFNQRWIELIMQCVKNVSYSILVNCQPQKDFKPLRGLRQGDLLSPYLFILCAKAFSSFLTIATNSGRISSVGIGRRLMRINHLFFANDSLLFCKENSIE